MRLHPFCGRLPQHSGFSGRTSDRREVRLSSVQRWVYGKSGREDSNLRPHGPEPCALAKLSYAPTVVMIKIDPLSSISIIGPTGPSAGSLSLLFVLLRRRPH